MFSVRGSTMVQLSLRTRMALVATLVVVALTPSLAATVRLCVPRQLNDDELQRCNSLIGQANSVDVQFQCASFASAELCMAAVNGGDADMVNLDGGMLYDAWNVYQLRPLVSENYGGKVGWEYNGVAIVNKAFCENNDQPTLEDLKDKNACMTGYGRAVGWKLPIGTMLQRNIMPKVYSQSGLADDAASAAAFFQSICAVASGNGPIINMDGSRSQSPELCSACRNTTDGECDTNDAYWDYAGAFRGVMEGQCAVAFTKDTVLKDFVQGGPKAQWWSTKGADEFRLLCPQGGCQTLDQADRCSFGKAPAHAFVVRAPYSEYGTNSSLGKSIQAALLAKARDPDWRAGLSSLDLLESETVSLDAQWVSSLSEYMDPNVVLAFDTLKRLERTARFCVVTDKEREACENVVSVLEAYDNQQNQDAKFHWSCVQADSAPECLDYVSTGRADFRMLDAINSFEARILYSLVPVVRESYGNQSADSYYSVGVVKASTCTSTASGTFGMEDLRNKSMCATAYRTAAGWWSPLASLTAVSAITAEPKRGNVAPDARAMSAFFDKVCAPGLGEHGPIADAYGNPAMWPPLCEACANPQSCNASDSYAGEQGPFRGLMAGACDVAFTRHEMPLEYAQDGDEADEAREWGVNLVNKADLRLVCASGGCDSLENYEKCNLGKIPARLMVTSFDYPYRSDMATLLRTASQDDTVREALFEGVEGFFAELTTGLVDVTSMTVFDYVAARLPTYQRLYNDQWLGQLDGNNDRDVEDLLLCVPYNETVATQSYISQCSAAIAKADDPDGGVAFSCIAGGSLQGCLNMIDEGSADIVVLDAKDQWYSINTEMMVPIVQEVYDNNRKYQDLSVAVVPSLFCSGKPKTFADLRGKDACMTGYGRIAGWQLPVGYMAKQGLLRADRSIQGLMADAYVVGEFFDRVCAPDVNYLGPALATNGSSLPYSKLCDGCKGTCSSNNIEEEEDGAEQQKALNCVVEGGDVAFVKYSAALNMDLPNYGRTNFDDRWGPGPSNEQKRNLRLLCPKGGCATLDGVADCFIDEVPARAVVGRTDMVGSEVAEALVKMGQSVLRAFSSIDGPDGFPFSKQAVNLELVRDWPSLWGDQTLETLRAHDSLRTPNASMCTTTPQAQELCLKALSGMRAGNVKVGFGCYYADDGDCARAVADGRADIATLDPYDAWLAMNKHQLQIVMAEGAAGFGSQQYAVAMVHKDMCESNPNITMKDLRGKNACMSGYRRAGGWIMPVGYMLYTKDMPYVSNQPNVTDDAESVAAFFDNVCAPRVVDNGPRTSQDGKGASWGQLCGSCAGDCNTLDPYYAPDGALRCLAENAGDVAFTTSTVPFTVLSDGISPSSWAGNWTRDDFRLLCPRMGGGCSPIEAYSLCNFAPVPVRTVMMRPSTPELRRIVAGLSAVVMDPSFNGNVLNNGNNPNNLIFNNNAMYLVPVDDPDNFFPPQVLAAFDGFQQLSGGNVTASGRP